ncbi:Variant surface glycoprotein [Trypanosoma congolense IL3000]|uniref:Variant surface glycoprotein n=1 Tax=Trypanosoma congolense (strain IL3000) TaxID=1068625 RepID=F9W5S1_TRYCI|nr:Variant surface glycoprotein [Trypanosoma congolense IL3000]
MSMKFWVVFCLCMMGVVRANDHNKEAHRALCDVLKAAANKWESVKDSDSPLKQALGRTIFGNKSGGNLETLGKIIPKDYEKVVNHSVSRALWCGQPYDNPHNQPRWPGHSAPHDLVCLCTTGKNGYPLNEDNSKQLCGKTLSDLGGETSQGWSQQGSGKSQVEATWNSVTSECLSGNVPETSLQNAMDALKQILVRNPNGETQYGNRELLGEGGSGKYPCGGSNQVCVMYYNAAGTVEHKPWWVALEKEINNEEQRQQQKKREEEKHKKEESQNNLKVQNQEQPQNNIALRTAALRYTTPSNEETEQSNPENISSPIATIEDTSGAFIIPPCTWLLNALLLS